MADRLAEAYERFEEAGREARELVESTPRFRDNPDHRPQAYVSLAEARAMSYNFVVAPRADHPNLHGQSSWHATFFSLGQNCRDFRYGALLLDGRRRYRLRGRVGDLKLHLVQVQSHVMGHPEAEEIGNHDLVELAGDDGAFDVEVGGGNGAAIPLNGDSLNFLLVRRILASIDQDPGETTIEPLDGPEPGPETDPEVVAERLELAAHMLGFLARDWVVGLYDMYIKAAGGKNRLANIAGKELASNVVGSPSTTYGLGVFELEPGEALILEWEPPQSEYWGVQLGDVWSNALDFTSYQTDLSMTTAAIDADGRFRAVISDRDPGIANWLDTRGRGEGSIAMRNYRAKGESADATVRVVPFDSLAGELPEDTAMVTPEQRAQTLTERRASFLGAYGD